MSQSEQSVSCIVCPMSCVGKVVFAANGQIQEVSGFSCPRGEKYAREEVTAPKRTLTTTVKVNNGELHLLPVISKPTLPKEKVIAAARCLSTLEVDAPIEEGTVVYHNILNLNVDIVATRDVARVSNKSNG